MKCWSCDAENDLRSVQTCGSCGAPLMKGRGVFSKPVLFGVLLVGLLCQAMCLATHWFRR